EKYPTVWQMVSTVVGETNASFSEILKSLFPAASITGAPKARTMEIIAELESSARQVYTGCVGYYSPGRKAQFNVAIRTVLIDNASGEAEYGVGGGITWDSVDAAEFDESQTKARVLTARLPDFSLLETMLWTPEAGYFLLDRHLKRLSDSSRYFSFPLDLAAVQAELARLAGTFKPKAMKVRLLVAEDGGVRVESDALPAGGEARPLRLALAPAPIDSTDPFLYHKTTHRQVYDWAIRSISENADGHWDDVILWNERGELTESTRANLLIELDGVRYTPPVDCGLLPGTYRGYLLDQELIKERVIRIEDLVNNPPLYLINSVRKQQAARVVLSR
ncbi:MAG TPA: chorismate-binding protein, partial [Anaerolineales bacterium]|nr:chorismate-binding protein [Anaerolineales bacterium]